MEVSVDRMLQGITEPNYTVAIDLWNDLKAHIPMATGSTRAHHAWASGYEDHIQEVMNLAHILYERLDIERPLTFALSSAYLVLFLHDCEKPFRHATAAQLRHFPWISRRPHKSDEQFQKQLIAHYGFKISNDEWNALKYVEGEKDVDYVEGGKLQRPLAAFCHVCDTISARIWYDYPEH